MKIDMKIIAEDLVQVDGIWRIVPNSRIEKPANSLLKQFLQYLLITINGVTITSLVKDTSGTNRTVPASTNNFKCTAVAGDATVGILLGTGVTAVTIIDYTMETLIADGVGAGQLQYGAVLFPDADVNVSGSICYFTLTRTFTNLSGGNISVTEVGLAGLGSSYKFLFDRTLYSKTINNGTGAIFTYRMQISV